MRPFVAAVSCPARSHNTWTTTPLLPQIKRRLIPPLTPSCLRYYIVHPSCAEKTRGERNTNEEQTVNSHDASEGAKRGRGSHHAAWIWLLSRSHCLVGGRKGGVMNGLYHTRRPTTAQTNYLTGGFCIGGWPQERACPVFYLFLIHTIAVAHRALRESGEGEWCSVVFSLWERNGRCATNLCHVECGSTLPFFFYCLFTPASAWGIGRYHTGANGKSLKPFYASQNQFWGKIIKSSPT